MEQGTVSDADRVVRFVVGTARCGDCGSAYQAQDVHILDQVGDNVWELAAVCPGCLNVWLVKAIVHRSASAGEEPPAGDGPLDELSPSERLRFGALPAVGMNDVLDVRAFLRTFDGDFRAHFDQERDGLA